MPPETLTRSMNLLVFPETQNGPIADEDEQALASVIEEFWPNSKHDASRARGNTHQDLHKLLSLSPLVCVLDTQQHEEKSIKAYRIPLRSHETVKHFSSQGASGQITVADLLFLASLTLGLKNNHKSRNYKTDSLSQFLDDHRREKSISSAIKAMTLKQMKTKPENECQKKITRNLPMALATSDAMGETAFWHWLVQDQVQSQKPLRGIQAEFSEGEPPKTLFSHAFQDHFELSVRNPLDGGIDKEKRDFLGELMLREVGDFPDVRPTMSEFKALCLTYWMLSWARTKNDKEENPWPNRIEKIIQRRYKASWFKSNKHDIPIQALQLPLHIQKGYLNAGLKYSEKTGAKDTVFAAWLRSAYQNQEPDLKGAMVAILQSGVNRVTEINVAASREWADMSIDQLWEKEMWLAINEGSADLAKSALHMRTLISCHHQEDVGDFFKNISWSVNFDKITDSRFGRGSSGYEHYPDIMKSWLVSMVNDENRAEAAMRVFAEAYVLWWKFSPGADPMASADVLLNDPYTQSAQKWVERYEEKINALGNASGKPKQVFFQGSALEFSNPGMRKQLLDLMAAAAACDPKRIDAWLHQNPQFPVPAFQEEYRLKQMILIEPTGQNFFFVPKKRKT